MVIVPKCTLSQHKVLALDSRPRSGLANRIPLGRNVQQPGLRNITIT